MKPEQILAVIVRLFSIALGIYLLNLLKNYPGFIVGYQFDFSAFIYLATIFCLSIVALILWKFPIVIAKGIGGFTLKTQNEVASLKYEELLQIGLIVLGLYLLFNVISDLSYWFVYTLIVIRDYENSYGLQSADKAAIVATFLELIFAVVLLVGNKRLAELFRRFRYGAN